MAAPGRLDRLLRLIGVLQSGLIRNTRELATECHVSRRTIFRDIRLLEQAGVPLQFDQERQGYWLPRTFLPPADLTLPETLSLVKLCRDMGREDVGLPFFRPAQIAGRKLLDNLPRVIRKDVGPQLKSTSIHLEPRHPLGGAEQVYDLLNHAVEKALKVRMRYNSATRGVGEFTTVLSPYHLMFKKRSWYVIGHSSRHRQVRTFHIGRILSAQLLEGVFRRPRRFSIDSYLRDAWSLIRGDESVDVVVRFQPLVARNVAEVQWHHTQRLHWHADGSLDFQVRVDGIDEISWWILGYGREAEVITPPELRDMLREHVADLVRIYAR